jgi:plastocyanin
MRRITTLVIALTAALAIAVGAEAMSVPKLTGTVGPGFTITLKKGTKKVTTLKPGKYTFVIKDLATDHNFHLKGPGVNKATSTPAKVTKTWTVTLKAGKYTYVCDPHKTLMKGSFTVK